MAQRPTKRNPEVIERIVDGLSVGTPLRELCRQEGMPNWRTVYAWIAADAELAAQIAQARDLGFDAIAEEALAIADDASNDYMTRRTKTGAEEKVLDAEHVQRSKLRIETRLKLLAKWSPRKYGEKVGLEHSGPDGAPIEISSTVGLAVAAVRELRGLRMDRGSLPAPEAPEAPESLPAPDSGGDLL